MGVSGDVIDHNPYILVIIHGIRREKLSRFLRMGFVKEDEEYPFNDFFLVAGLEVWDTIFVRSLRTIKNRVYR